MMVLDVYVNIWCHWLLCVCMPKWRDAVQLTLLSITCLSLLMRNMVKIC